MSEPPVEPPASEPPSAKPSDGGGLSTTWKVVIGVLFPPIGIYWLLRSPRIGRGAKIAIASVAGVFLLIIIIAAASGGSSNENAAQSNPSATTTAAATTATTPTTTAHATPTTTASKPTTTASTPKQRVKESVGDTVAAGGYAGDVKIKKVDFYGDFVGVTAETPEGGLQGPSCDDLDTASGAIFEKVYNGTGWKGHAVIEFHGGLVSKATGKPSNDETGSSSMTPGQAKQINWSSSDQLSNIDWSIYRDYCHPALR